MTGSSERFVTVIFTGTADIHAENAGALLGQWFRELEEDFLPDELEFDPPVIESGPFATEGLKKVYGWLSTEEQFGPDGLETQPGDLLDYITAIEPGPDQYLVVLWEPGDERTEKIVDQAQRLGFTILDLAHGMEEFALESGPPEPEPEPAPSRARRGRRLEAVAQETSPAPQAPEHAAESAVSLPELHRVVAAEVRRFLGRAFLAALKELEELGEPGTPPVRGGGAQDVPAPAGNVRAVAAAPDDPDDGEPVRYRADQDVPQPPGTRKYQIDPETGQYRAFRGRPSTKRAHWDYAYLTSEQESDLDV